MRRNNNKNTNASKSNATGCGKPSNNMKDYGKRRARSSKCNNKQEGMNKDTDLPTNDMSWYTRFPELIKDAASISYAYPAGTGIPAINNWTTPGFICNHVSMVVPYTMAPTDPVNVSGVNTYIKIRMGKSGNAPYDPTDVSMLLFAMSHIYAYINWLQRIYGIVSTYSTQNKYLPEAILTAENISYSSIISNLANFRYGINNLINKVSALVIPDQNEIPLFSRYAFMFKNIYIGSGSIKDQMYLNTPDGFYQYHLANDALEWCDAPTFRKVASYKDLLDYGDMLLEYIYGDTDIATMCSDIAYAYGDHVIKLSLLPDDYPIVPIYDPVVLEQFHNATVLDNELLHKDVEAIGSASETPYLRSNPKFQVDKYYKAKAWEDMFGATAHQLIATSNPNPDIATTVENTRLKFQIAGIQKVDPENYLVSIANCTEIITQSEVFYYKGYDLCNSFLQTLEINPGTTWNALWSRSFSAKLSCQYRPLHYLMFVNTDPDEYEIESVVPMFNVDNYSSIPGAALYNLNRTVQLSLLALPLTNVM